MCEFVVWHCSFLYAIFNFINIIMSLRIHEIIFGFGIRIRYAFYERRKKFNVVFTFGFFFVRCKILYLNKCLYNNTLVMHLYCLPEKETSKLPSVFLAFLFSIVPVLWNVQLWWAIFWTQPNTSIFKNNKNNNKYFWTTCSSNKTYLLSSMGHIDDE